MPRLIEAFSQFFDDNGDPLINGKLKFVESGTNNTDKDTFADINETIKNTNPVILDGAGRCPNVFGTGSYNVISYTSSDIQIQQFDPVSGDTLEGAFSVWNAIAIYGEGDIVTGSDGLYYRSIASANQNQNPIVTPGQWEEFKFIGIWNTVISYSIGDVVYGSDGYTYRSLVDTNVGNDPITDTVNWGNSAIPDWIIGATYSKGNLVFGSNGLLYSSNIDANTGNDPTTDPVNWNNIAENPVVADYIHGLTLSNAVDVDHDVTIAAGGAADSTNLYNLELSSSLTKQIDAGWVAGDNVGGRFTGTTDIDTWYHMFLIRKDSDGSIDAGFDTSVTAANIPAGYTAYRRIGSILTDVSANIIQFKQYGNRFDWVDPPLDQNGALGNTTRNSITLSTPVDVQLSAIVGARLTADGAGNDFLYISNLDTIDGLPGSGYFSVVASTTSEIYANTFEVITNTSSQVGVRASDAAIAVGILTIGWIDNRGQ